MNFLIQALLITYTVTSPFMFLYFHKHVLGQTWDDDLADRVTVRLYVISNIAVQTLGYILEECGKCG